MAELGLNEQHQSLIMTYIRFAKQQRAQNLKAVYCAFQDVIESRLAEATYTAEEVRELVCGLREAVLADVEAELRSCGRAAALLLRQLLAQAERWHLRLAADMSQLHDREQLEQVAALEESGAAQERAPAAGGRLAPLSAEGSSGAEARRLEAECAALQGQLEEARLLVEELMDCGGGGGARQRDKEAQVRQQQIIRLNDELDSAREKLAVAAASSQLTEVKDRQEAADPGAGDRVPELEERVSQLSLHLSGSEDAKADLERQLAGTREELAAAEAKLALAEQELERKFSETTAYSNMKRMLASKNEQLRELRSRLRTSGEGGEGGAGAEDEED